MRILILVLIHSLFFSLSLSAQGGKHPSKTTTNTKTYSVDNLQKLRPLTTQVQQNGLPTLGRSYQPLGAFQSPVYATPNLTFVRDTGSDLPILIKGTIGAREKGNSMEERCHSFLTVVQKEMQIEHAENEFSATRIETDDLGMTHIRMQQYYQGLPVYGSEVILHEKNGQIRSLNGRYFPTPQLANLSPTVTVETAFAKAKSDVAQYTNVADIPATQQNLVLADHKELVIFHPDMDINGERLVWKLSFHPNIKERWNYFVDAQTGEIVQANRASCSFACMHTHTNTTATTACEKHHEHNTAAIALPPMPTVFGPATATATDLQNINRTINVYETQGTYFLIDASRSMFNSGSSNIPDQPVGVIWTIDGNNTSPQSNNFNTTHVTSNNNNWTDRSSVSAHYNGGLAYEYFRNTFQRNSINGAGGNVVSIINVADENGGSMDNAFWNGAAMFYGNGGQAFDPLAKALDVAGHEISHGVIQKTANLEYVAQSGALNESFADIFGAMIDRNDWRMGEDVVNTQFFPSGALRDLQNPNNGGSQLGDPGWQPAHMDEYANLPNTPQGDNGGVHINSGIPNRAFYLLASNIGKDNAEQIFYKALTEYLTKSSQFIDCRIAVLQAAADMFGTGSNEVAAADNAFSGVGITGGGQPTNTQQEIEENPGENHVLYTDANLSQLFLADGGGNNSQLISNTDIISKPSVTDDGTAIVFVGSDKKMYIIEIDWSTGALEEYILSDDPTWRNVAISKDGQRIAALMDDNDNLIWIYDFGLQAWQTYELSNPTFTEGVSTGDVRYADVIEWDFTGEHVMYDAFNEIESSFGEDISYWDIGFMKVWDNSSDSWANSIGNISKLFSGLPENTSVGNPTFSKNSDFIVAFDFIDENNNSQLFSVNIETGETSEEPIYTNGVLNYPNFNISDDKIIFDAQAQGGGQVLGVIDIASDKLNAAGSAALFIDGGKWGIYFAEGERDLVDIEVVDAATLGVSVFPNPVTNTLQITSDIIIEDDVIMTLSDIYGQTLLTETIAARGGQLTHQVDVSRLVAGSYLVQLRSGEQLVVVKVVKM